MHATILRILGFVFVIFGAGYVLSPETLMEATGLTGSASGITDVRATYGGFQIGFGIFMILAASRPAYVGIALFATAIVVGFVGLCRGFGLVIDGSPSATNIGALVFEFGLAALTFWLHGGATPKPETAVS